MVATRTETLREAWEDYDSHGLELRSCDRMRYPHHPHDWPHPDLKQQVHCWGRNRLPRGVIEAAFASDCSCQYHHDLRHGQWPRTIMCQRDWRTLSVEARMEINDSMDD